jgi:hypothetical protein
MRTTVANRRLAIVLVVVGVLGTPVRHAWSRVVDASEAAAYVGSAVTVEGDVAVARTESIGLVLELAPLGPTSVRAVLVPSLISSLPRAPERIYEGKRVRITGLLQRFKGRPELVLESPSQIEIVEFAGAPPPTTTTVAPPAPVTTTLGPAPSSMPAVAAPPAPGPSAAAPPPPPPAPSPSAVSPPAPVPTPAPPTASAPPPPSEATPTTEPAPKPLLSERLAAEACDRARARWRDAADRTREATAALTRCLDGASFACHDPAAALAPILADLEWAEQQVADRCR